SSTRRTRLPAAQNVAPVQPLMSPATHRDREGTKILCDLREEQMIRFALEAWKLEGEYADTQFVGMYSFAYEGSSYRYRESLNTKAKQNYLLIDAVTDAATDAAIRRRDERVQLLEAI
ncbi:hypothetical protein, partial [Roseovarius sp. SYSU LYC5161]|uniref:hypothetical protein n=1 Tax=Roseovarius halophilus (ex Wu et al. 2025) TaxID=3376060 RepID=UPI00399BFD38